MTKKQFGLIFTLMLLIVCVGVLAMRLNDKGVLDPSDLGDALAQNFNDPNSTDVPVDDIDDEGGESEALSTQSSLYSMRSEKEQKDMKAIDDLKKLKDDENTSQEQKDVITSEITQKTLNIDNENRVEMNIKNKGYEDALCFIEGNDKVRVVVKADNLSDKESGEIQEIVEDVTNISNIIIELKK